MIPTRYQDLELDYLKGTIRHCEATKMNNGKGGEKRWRLCFDDPSLNLPQYRIAAKTNLCCLQWGYLPFTISFNGCPLKIFLHAKSLSVRFMTPLHVIKKASEQDNLHLVVDLIQQMNNRYRQSLIDEIRKFQKTGYLSAKKYRLPQSIYVKSDFLAYKIRKSLIGEGGSAKVKQAKLEDGTIIARRVVTLKDQNKKASLDRTVENIYRLHGKEGVLECLGVFKYFSLKGFVKLVTLHPLGKDFFDYLQEGTVKLTEAEKLNYIERLLQTLVSLGGNHRDLCLENILIKGGKLYLHDFQYFKTFEEEDGKQFGHRATTPPELYEKGKKIDPLKLDAWSLGNIVLILLTYPCFKQISLRVSQPIIDQQLSYFHLSKARYGLVHGLLQVDPSKRFTIEQALKYFNEHRDALLVKSDKK